MVRSTRFRLEEAITRTDQLLQTLVETSEFAMSKVKELPAVGSGGWSLAERLGTPEAAQTTAEQAKEA